MSGGLEPFKTEKTWSAARGGYDRSAVAVCGKCKRWAIVADNSAKARPPVFFADKFRRKGWRIGQRRSADVCPRCIVGGQPQDAAQAPAQPIISEKPKEAAMTKTATAPAAEPPRQPTREDKHKIRDALNACYLIDKNCYAGDGSDKALAEKLKVPRAWVTAEREDAYGPDACEADRETLAALDGLRETLAKYVNEAMTIAANFDALGREVEALKVKHLKRGAA